MGLAGGDVLPVQVAVEIDRGVDLLHDRGGFVAAPPTPHFVAHDTYSEGLQVLSPMTELPAEPYYKVRRRRLIAATAWALAGTLAVLAGVYGIGRLRGNPAAAACGPAVQTAARLAPLAHGEVAALSLAHT